MHLKAEKEAILSENMFFSHGKYSLPGTFTSDGRLNSTGDLGKPTAKANEGTSVDELRGSKSIRYIEVI